MKFLDLVVFSKLEQVIRYIEACKDFVLDFLQKPHKINNKRLCCRLDYLLLVPGYRMHLIWHGMFGSFPYTSII